MTNPLTNFKKAPKIRPLLNIGCLFDIPTGRYVKGQHGERILNGGLSYITGLGGRGNTYKSTIAHFMMLRTLDRYTHSSGVAYDTEISLTMGRLKALSKETERLKYLDFDSVDEKLILTDKTVMDGSKFFETFRAVLKERTSNKDKHLLTTPFCNVNGELLKATNPFISEIDSLSQMEFEVVESMYDKAEVGDSKLNTEALKSAAAKSQMLVQLPGLTGGGGGYIIMTAHLGDEHKLDPYAPSTKKLSFLKNQVKFKRVPENFTFLTNNFWLCASASVLINQGTKGAEYPRTREEQTKGDTDLMCITIQNLRAKSGPTGLPVEIIASQSDGVHVGLTEFNYLKKSGKYGIGGNDRTYYLELMPDVNLQRTTIRSVIDETPKLKRALEFTSEMCQMKNLWHDLPSSLLCTPKELYEGIKERGYDWDTILEHTRGYWVFKEDEPNMDKEYLSTMDLLRMNAGKYHPYWWDDFMKKKNKK